MYCDNCGCELGENSRKCPVCGKEFPMINPVQEDEEGTTVLTSSQMGHADVQENTGAQNQNGGNKPENQNQTNDQISGVQNQMNGQMPGVQNQMNGQTLGVQKQANGQIPDNQDIMIRKKGEKKGMSKGAKAALIIIPILVVAAIAVLAVIYVPKFRKYNEAEDLMTQGKVEEAVTIYKDLGDFKDSYIKGNGAAYYRYAAELEKDGRNLEAAEYYKKSANSMKAAEDYGRSDDKNSDEIDSSDAFDKADQCYYNAGMDQMNAASYDSAIEAFKNAGTYKDSSDKVIECTYKKAQALIGSKDYDGAIEILSTIEDYSDVKNLLAQCYYNKGSELLKAGKYDEAYDMYTKSEYDDYKKKASECTYQKAGEYYKEKDYKNALKSYEKVDSSYKKCIKEKDKCYIGLASQEYKNKNYKSSVEYYEKVQKTDVSEKIVKAKLAYISANKNASNETTMTYIGQLRYAGNEKAQKVFLELVKWNIESFVNSSEKDMEKKSNTITAKAGSDIYIHTSFSFSGDDSMKISGYVVYSDGNKSDSISFSDNVVDGWSSWVKINGDGIPKGVTYLYLVNDNTDKIIEVYPFTVK